MQRTTKPRKPTKAHRNFKLPPHIDTALRRESKKTRLTQTVIVELALAKHLGLS